MGVEAFYTEVAGITVGLVAITVHSRRVMSAKGSLALFAAEDVSLLERSEGYVVLAVLVLRGLVEALTAPRADSRLEPVCQMAGLVELSFIPAVLDVADLAPHYFGDDNPVADTEYFITV